jgi:hypothetical protein
MKHRKSLVCLLSCDLQISTLGTVIFCAFCKQRKTGYFNRNIHKRTFILILTQQSDQGWNNADYN